MVLHFRRTLEELNDAELRLANLRIGDFLEETTSYLSVVELGLYPATSRIYTELEAGLSSVRSLRSSNTTFFSASK